MQHKVENVMVQSTQLRRLHVDDVDPINGHKYISFLDLCTRSRGHTEAGGSKKSHLSSRARFFHIRSMLDIQRATLRAHTDLALQIECGSKGHQLFYDHFRRAICKFAKAGVSVRVRSTSLELRNNKHKQSIGSGTPPLYSLRTNTMPTPAAPWERVCKTACSQRSI